MSYKTPKDIARAGIETGSTKARLSWDKALVAGFLAGAYIAIAGLLAMITPSFLIIPLMKWMGSRSETPR